MENYTPREPRDNNAPPARRKQKKQSGCAGALLYLVVIFGIAALLSMVLLFSANDVFAFVKDNRSVTLTVPEDTTVKALSKELDQEGVIHYGSLFKLFVTVTGKDTTVLAGDYTLNPSMDYGAIIRSLRNSTGENTVTITIPEGYTIDQIREALLKHHVCSEESLDDALNTYPFKWDFLKGKTPGKNWLEGYLFPDTYEFYQKNDSAVQVINKMLNNFADKFDQPIADGAAGLGRSMHDIVTIASLVEREAQKEDEFAEIAGVIYNRLNNSQQFPYLQIDATVQYAVGHKDQLTEADLKVDSPYNTYTNKGLPPGPIASPGYTALYAASHPEDNGYYYYVAMPDGSHLFAKTNAEHEANKRKAAEAFEKASTQ
ncbi:endolytic transglycosylase MltG [Intestinibacillus massiliensis]|uniref:endolytic transglycosylase MltG n=1 Tax=Intestinibacillus massiliensis TaxID=1871029 RepID=UPI000B34C30A|nr:endolytic transglycosylase MltG [Intestinibacillus massiliensis]